MSEGPGGLAGRSLGGGCRGCSARFSSGKQTSGLNKLFVKLTLDKQEAVCQAEGGLAGLRRVGWDLSAEIFSR